MYIMYIAYVYIGVYAGRRSRVLPPIRLRPTATRSVMTTAIIRARRYTIALSPVTAGLEDDSDSAI